MSKLPLVLVSPDIESKGKEHGDRSISLSQAYLTALIEAGSVPVTLPDTISREVVAESVARTDGVVLTGGDDVDPRLYATNLPGPIRRTVAPTPDGGERDYRELLVIDEVFRQHKPLLAICRGQQILNVALGGTLLADIPKQKPQAANHRRTDRRDDVVHEVRLTPGSILYKIVGAQKLAVNSTHHQAVARVATPLRATAVGNDGVVEGLELKRNGSCWLPFLLGVQFHPERLVDRYPAHRAIFGEFVQVCRLGRKNNL
jgi:putative glutamine amidotransferase